MISRDGFLEQLKNSIKTSSVTAILGTRQCGKTTLARLIYDEISSTGTAIFFDLQDPADAKALENPKLTLENISGLIVIDEIQLQPQLFPILRVLVDQHKDRKFLILGSASPKLIKSSAESLAGRISYIDLSGFNLEETGVALSRKLWIRGGFPLSFLAVDEQNSFQWRENYIRTFLERDIPALGINIPQITLRRFWTMVAHYHGQIWNGAEFARSLGTSENTARHYLDILTGAYVVRQLAPWHENLKKRQVKAPRIYVRDTGILHALLGLENEIALLSHTKAGSSWEGFVVEQIFALAHSRDIYFWSLHSGAEIDCLVFKNGKRFGFEIKLADSPTVTRSMHSAIQDLNLNHLYVVYPGDKTFPLTEKVTALAISGLVEVFKG